MTMAVKRKNRISVLLMAAVTAVFLVSSLYVGGNCEGEVYDELRTFLTPADPDAVFYNEATRTTINYEVNERESEKPADNVTKEDFDRINDTYVSEYFLYNLSDAEQKVYHQLYKGIYDLQENIPIESNVLAQDDIGDFIVLFIVSNPYVNYIGGSYTISLNKKGYVTGVNVQYSHTAEQAYSERQELDRKIDEILMGINDNMSQYEKVKYLHDYIVTNCEYDDDSEQPYSAYGCLVQGRCVCEGYAKAMLVLCERAGINAIPVIGQAGETGEGQGHIWNKIMIDEKWYDFDVTWDDPVGDMGSSYVRYDYFGMNDEQFDRTHLADKNKYMYYPEAISSDADYFVVNDLMCDDGRKADETMKRAIKLALENGDGIARIKCTDKDAYKRAVERLFETKDGTTEMFSLLNDALTKKDEEIVMKYSIVQNDGAYTITVRFENGSQ